MSEPTKRPRLDIFDGLRGHLLIGMLVAHLSFQTGLEWLGNFHHNRVVLIFDAEFFVLIAGLLVGYLWNNAYKTTALRRRFVINRLFTIYRYYLLSALPFLVFSALSDTPLFKIVLGVTFMQIGGWYSDILPIYFYCFLVLAPFVVFPRLNSPVLMFAVSASIYIASQLTDLGGFFGASNAFVAFDVAAWQFLFVCSILIGKHGKTICNQIAEAQASFAAVVLLVILAVSLVLRQNSFYPNPLLISESLTGNAPRMGLHPLFLLRIFLLSAAAAIVLIRNDLWIRPVHKIAHWYFGLSVIRNVGKYSIQMFVLHVYIMALYKIAYVDAPNETKAAFAVVWIAVFIATPNLWLFARSRLVRQ